MSLWQYWKCSPRPPLHLARNQNLTLFCEQMFYLLNICHLFASDIPFGQTGSFATSGGGPVGQLSGFTLQHQSLLGC